MKNNVLAVVSPWLSVPFIFPFNSYYQMNSFTRWTAFSILLSTSLASCNKDKEMQDIAPTPPASVALPVVVDGHLKFSSLESFHAFLKANENKTQEELMQLNRDMGFVSHLRLYNEEGLQPTPTALRGSQPANAVSATANSAITGLNGPVANAGGTIYADEPMTTGPVIGVISPEIPDPLLDSALDINQEILINNLTVRVGNDYTFYYPAGQSALVDDFYQKVDTGEINLTDADMHNFGDLVVQRNSMITNPINGGTTVGGGSTSPGNGSITSAAIPFFGNKSVEGTKNFDQTHRIECQIWQGNWGIYASSGIKTHGTQYARKWGFFHGWVDFGPDQITATANVTYNLPNASGGTTPTIAQALSISETNKAVAVKRFDWSTAIIGYTNAPGGVAQQIQSILLSSMTVTVANPAYVPPSTNPRPTFNPSTLTLQINKLTSIHTGRGGSNTISLPLTW